VITEEKYKDYLDSLLAGNKNRCKEIVEEHIHRKVDIKDLYTQLFQRSMYKVGELWEHNKISIATEHLATTITQGLLPLVYPIIFAADRIGKRAIITCIANEFHQIGGKMVADIFELNGWDGYFLGANTPSKSLLQILGEKEPDIVGLSISLDQNIPALVKTIELIHSRFKNQNIVVGGRALVNGGADAVKDMKKVLHVTSIYELEKIIKED
jgi:methanogenic corrinoid protein MtbC1